MAHAQKPDFFFRRNGRVHLNRRGCQFSWLLAAELCLSAVVMLDTPCSEVVWRVLATHSICQFPHHFPSRASPCAITFQLDSRIEWNRIRKVGYRTDPCTSNFNDLLYRPFVHAFISTAPWTGCRILVVEMSVKSPGFVKYWRRNLNLNVAYASQPQTTREAVSDACWHAPHSRISANLSLSNVRLGDSTLLAFLSIFVTGFCSKSVIPQLFQQCLVRKPFACLCPRIGSQYPSCFLLVQPQATPVGMSRASPGPESGS
jgi:hypothetical protein